MGEKRIYIAVTNDLVTDQRVHRTAMTLLETGAKLTLVGVKRPQSQEINDQQFEIYRFRLIFLRGFLFYASFNIRLFFYLLFRRTTLLVSNDLDTLLAVYLSARIKNVPLVYDSHEYFTEVPELVNRKRVRRIWERIEKFILPKIQYGYTVSQSIAQAYEDKYGIWLPVVRNLPIAVKYSTDNEDSLNKIRDDVSSPSNVIIYQGFLNMGRGLELMIRTMAYLDNCQFKIFGDGDIKQDLLNLRNSLSLENHVIFMGRIPFRELGIYTKQATLGISLEENIGMNYYYALPNKLFDYIQAHIPVIVSDLPEMRRIVLDYNIGQVLKNREPEQLAEQIEEILSSRELRKGWKKNLIRAANDLCWENEVEKFRNVYRKAGLVFPTKPHLPNGSI